MASQLFLWRLTSFLPKKRAKVDWNEVRAQINRTYAGVPFVLGRLKWSCTASKCNGSTPAHLEAPRCWHKCAIWAHTWAHFGQAVKAAISLTNGRVLAQKTQGVRTPLLGGTRPLQSKLFHSGGLRISSVNRAAGLLSSLLLELILTQWPGRLPFCIWSTLNSQMARRPEVSCVIVQILVNWANGGLGRGGAEWKDWIRKEPTRNVAPSSFGGYKQPLVYYRANSCMWCLSYVLPCTL